MLSDPTTAAELHALVSQWPVEARDKDLVFNPANKYGETLGWECEGEFITDRHAIALHEASGIRWLAEHAKEHISVTNESAGSGFLAWTVWACDGEMFTAPTFIEAIHAAIMATEKESRP